MIVTFNQGTDGSTTDPAVLLTNGGGGAEPEFDVLDVGAWSTVGEPDDTFTITLGAGTTRTLVVGTTVFSVKAEAMLHDEFGTSPATTATVTRTLSGANSIAPMIVSVTAAT